MRCRAESVKRDEIAGRQLFVLRQYQSVWEKPISIPDIKEMIEEMKDHN
jgi:hypothetical protein